MVKLHHSTLMFVSRSTFFLCFSPFRRFFILYNIYLAQMVNSHFLFMIIEIYKSKCIEMYNVSTSRSIVSFIDTLKSFRLVPLFRMILSCSYRLWFPRLEIDRIHKCVHTHLLFIYSFQLNCPNRSRFSIIWFIYYCILYRRSSNEINFIVDDFLVQGSRFLILFHFFLFNKCLLVWLSMIWCDCHHRPTGSPTQSSNRLFTILTFIL